MKLRGAGGRRLPWHCQELTLKGLSGLSFSQIHWWEFAYFAHFTLCTHKRWVGTHKSQSFAPFARRRAGLLLSTSVILRFKELSLEEAVSLSQTGRQNLPSGVLGYQDRGRHLATAGKVKSL